MTVRHIQLLVVMMFFWQVDIMIWQVDINNWQVNIKIWRVEIIFWQVMAEICHYIFDIGRCNYVVHGERPLIRVTTLSHTSAYWKLQKKLNCNRSAGDTWRFNLWSGPGAIKARRSHFWSQSHFSSIYSFTESEIETKSETVSLLWPRNLVFLSVPTYEGLLV